MSFFSLILLLFTLVLYLFIFVVQKEIVYRSKRRMVSNFFIVVLAFGAFFFNYQLPGSLDQNIRGVIAGLIILSFVFDNKGLADDRIVVSATDKNGVPYRDVHRVALYQQEGLVKMNFFRRGMRGPLLKFSQPLEEIVTFLAERLPEGTPIDILVDQHDKDDSSDEQK